MELTLIKEIEMPDTIFQLWSKSVLPDHCTMSSAEVVLKMIPELGPRITSRKGSDPTILEDRDYLEKLDKEE